MVISQNAPMKTSKMSKKNKFSVSVEDFTFLTCPFDQIFKSIKRFNEAHSAPINIQHKYAC